MFILILSISLFSICSKTLHSFTHRWGGVKIHSGGCHPLLSKEMVEFWVIMNEDYKNTLHLEIWLLQNIKYDFSRYNITLFEKPRKYISPIFILVYNRSISFFSKTSFDHSGREKRLISEFITQLNNSQVLQIISVNLYLASSYTSVSAKMWRRVRCSFRRFFPVPLNNNVAPQDKSYFCLSYFGKYLLC